jgi:hypothetical protein
VTLLIAGDPYLLRAGDRVAHDLGR